MSSTISRNICVLRGGRLGGVDGAGSAILAGARTGANDKGDVISDAFEVEGLDEFSTLRAPESGDECALSPTGVSTPMRGVLPAEPPLAIEPDEACVKICSGILASEDAGDDDSRASCGAGGSELVTRTGTGKVIVGSGDAVESKLLPRMLPGKEVVEFTPKARAIEYLRISLAVGRALGGGCMMKDFLG